jgi:hypothetical protein
MDVGDIGWKGMDWFHVAQGRDQWQSLTNVNFQISQNARNFFLAEHLVASQEGLRPKDYVNLEGDHSEISIDESIILK